MQKLLCKNHIEEIQQVEIILEEVRKTSSSNEKIQILKTFKENEELKKVLEYTYNVHKKYGVSNMKNINRLEPNAPAEGDNIWCILDKLSDSNINDSLRQELRNYLESFKDISSILEGIVTKDLRLGVNATTINKVWKGLIPTSETSVTIKPMLASKFDFTKPPAGDFVVTEKLDGIRCMAICTEDDIQLYTRQGKLIEGCKEIEESLRLIRKYMETDIVLDGELLADGCDYETVYKETTKRVKNKNKVKTDIHYTIFDILEYDEFCEQKCTMPYYERLEVLCDIFEYFGQGHRLPKLELIQALYAGSDINRLLELLEEYRNKGAEGLMVNLTNGLYEFKRSKQILKVKVMQTADLKIVGFEEGQGRNAGKLGALLVDFKGNEVGVGTGFSDFDRVHIWENKDKYIGKICEIQYFEISKDKNGVESLRFPVFKTIRFDKTEESLY